MKTLFFTIFVVVFTICQLIIPDYFDKAPDNIPTAEAEFLEEIATGIVQRTGKEPQTQPTATETVITETPANNSSDPGILFGEPKQEDTFSRGSSGFGLNAGLNEDEAIRIIAINNKLSLEPKKNNGWLNWRLRPPVIQDGAAEMDFSITTCARGDRVGIVMHAPDYTEGHGYYFNLACEGTVSIMKDSSILGSSSVTEIFKNGSGDINTLTAVVRGNKLTALLNGEEVLSVQDNTYSEGFSGFFTAPQSQDTLRLDILSFTSYY